MGLTESLVNIIVNFIGNTGYASILILMALESMIVPVPSEAVMPFAGFLIVSGEFSFPLVILFSSAGSITGSLISYYIGRWGGRPFIEKCGRYILLDKHHLDLTEKYFTRRGDITILICRFIPVVRHLISIPAGIGKMNLPKFLLYTLIGAGIWNTFLAYIGFVLKSNWTEVMKYSHIIDICIVLAIVGAIGYYIYRFCKHKTNYPSGKAG
jgi:membrane protein DedA with SNARE-associated domain